MADPARRLGVYGGTFDPIHTGHLCIAEEARSSLHLEQVLFIPAHVSPLKVGQVAASAEDRLAMVQLAVADNPAFQVLRIELDRPAPSFTVDTLRALQAAYGAGCELTLILGGDSLAALPAWREAAMLPRLARLAVYPRPGAAPDLAALERALPGLGAAVVLLNAAQLEISATEIRQRVQCGRSIRYLVPADVEDYIRAHGLYRSDEGAAPRQHACS